MVRKLRNKFLSSIILLFAAGGPCLAQRSDLAMLTQYMTGSFSSEEQAIQDTSYRNIQLHMVQIWTDLPEVWIYVEQASAETPEKPYRQRVYKLTEDGKNKFSSYVYQISNPEEWVGLWSKPRKAKAFDKSQLTELEGCALRLIFVEGKFIGNTNEQCPNSWNGATVATSEVVIEENILMSWDRGWDSAGNQIWGAKSGGYIFKKQP